MLNSRSFVAEPGFNHRENNSAIVQLLKRHPNGAEKFSTRFLQQIQIARVINVIADRAFGVGNAVSVNELLVRHAQSETVIQ